MTPIPREPTGKSRLSQLLRDFRRALLERTPLESSGMLLTRAPHGFHYQPIGRGGKAGTSEGGDLFKQFSIVRIEDDVLVCNPYRDNGTIDTDTSKNVAKPWRLRKSFFDGRTIAGITYSSPSGSADDGNTRLASAAGSGFETQTVTPFYGVGDIIVAISPVDGLAGEGGLVVGDPSVDSGAVDWLDLNLDGRAWGSPFG